MSRSMRLSVHDFKPEYLLDQRPVQNQNLSGASFWEIAAHSVEHMFFLYFDYL